MNYSPIRPAPSTGSSGPYGNVEHKFRQRPFIHRVPDQSLDFRRSVGSRAAISNKIAHQILRAGCQTIYYLIHWTINDPIIIVQILSKNKRNQPSMDNYLFSSIIVRSMSHIVTQHNHYLLVYCNTYDMHCKVS